METRRGYRVCSTIVNSCHGNDDEIWSTSCLIMQHKPDIVQLSFIEAQKSHDSINEGLSLTTEGPMSHFRQNLSLIYILPIPVIPLVALRSYTNLHTFV